MKCIVSNCSNDTKKASGSEFITFHVFPKEPSERTLWIQILGITDRKQIYRSIICSEHFCDDDFYETKLGLRKIRNGAVPRMNKDSADNPNEPATAIVCRICLTTDVKMYDFREYGLDEMYEQITGIMICGEERLPQRVCWECSARLISASHFRNRALTSLQLLQEMLSPANYVITLRDIKSVNRTHSGLKTTLVKKVFDDNDYDMHIRDIFVKEEDVQEVLPTSEPVEVEIEDFPSSSEVEVKDTDSSEEDEDHSANDDHVVLSKVCEEKIIDKIKVKEKVKPKKRLPVKKIVKPIEKAETSTENIIEELKNSFTKRSAPDLNKKMFTITSLSFEQQIEEIRERQNSEAYKSAPYQCRVCFRGYENEDSYKAHAIKHDEKCGMFECFVCKTRLKTRHAQRNHINARHREQYSCNSCNFVTRHRGVAKEHERWHAGTKYQCPRCDCEFDKRSTYMGHIRIKHVSDFVCELCGFTFVSKKGIDVHKILKHRLVDKNAKLDGPHCAVCDVTFMSEEAHRRHLVLSSKHSDDRNPGRIRNSFQSTYKTRAKPRERFVDGQLIKEPGVARGSNEPITCKECGTSLQNLRAYAQHIRRVHPEKNPTQLTSRNRPFMCEQCGKIFRARIHLKTHMWVHTGVKYYKCDICTKGFTQKGNLIGHMKSHVGRKPTYECPLCGKHFANTNNRKRHMFLHTGLKPFKCEACGKLSTSMGEHKTHFEHVHLKKPWPTRIRPKRTRKREPSPLED